MEGRWVWALTPRNSQASGGRTGLVLQPNTHLTMLVISNWRPEGLCAHGQTFRAEQNSPGGFLEEEVGIERMTRQAVRTEGLG